MLSPSVYFNLALSNNLRSAGSNFFDKIAQKNASEKTIATVVTIIKKLLKSDYNLLYDGLY